MPGTTVASSMVRLEQESEWTQESQLTREEIDEIG